MAAGDQVNVLPLDEANDSTTSLPSLLYISREGDRVVGRGAADTFIERNVDREVITEMVDLGVSIQGYVGGEQDKEDGYRPPADDAPQEAVRAHALVEVNSPGRLFQSLKSSLRHRDHKGTEVFGENHLIEELTAMILRPMKQAVDAHAGDDVDTAVFGRPVRFSADPTEDKIAERRLRTAAGLAGFKDVVFFYEPVAACVEYAIATERTQRLMVVDIGGGTCDVCVMEFGGAQHAADRLAASRILATTGVPIAGDAVDREVIHHKLFPCFGSLARYGPNQLPMPQFIFSGIADWQNLYKFNTEETVNWLIAAETSSTHPEAIRALRCLIQTNYGYPITRVVELAKKALSSEEMVPLNIHKDEINIAEQMSRLEFEGIVEDTLDDMLAPIQEAERAAQLRPEDIDLVLTTGGTSLIPAVRRKLEERYGRDHIVQRETFTSVASGLAIVARYL
jgi:hypothetical chaperone protein